MTTPEFQTEMQRRVYKLLSEPLDTDVSIEDLFMCAYPGTPIERYAHGGKVDQLSNRDMQQYLGPLFARMNTRLDKHGMRIRPGVLKRTYRLSATLNSGN